MEPAIKIPRRAKKISEEKKVQQKMSLRARRQERKRSTEDFDHYENMNVSEYYFENQFRKASFLSRSCPHVFFALVRMTSGVMIAAKNYDASLRIATQIGEREVKKYYICCVDGLFPSNINNQNDSAPDSSVDYQADDVVKCTEPLGPLCSKMGLHAVMRESEGGKPARTHFIRLVYDAVSHTSLVLCRLYTGRTHQIRVHLQFLGYPIVEDPLYNSTDWGPEKGKNAQYGIPIEEVIQRISNSRTASAYLQKDDEGEEQNKGLPQDSLGHERTPFERFVARVHRDRSSLDSTVQDQLIASFDPHCPDCQRCYRDPEMHQLVLRLHAYRYTGSDWTYTAPLPDWAMSTVPAGLSLTDRIETCIARLEAN
ncbi:Pseudouridine synthase [Fasciolopsis buskii]|uniref:Pseudouridine synthase n=1 Tax=Fasciolopsis buskii TaxID=27845 RepID=A0A8E0RR31_9TREM|nr:Pseudouridine synthase [Fasciolopsis buski]